MKKLTLLVATLMMATFTFAQNSGQWSFGAGTDFTSPTADANIGYFIMDGLMINAAFNMTMDYEEEHMHDGEMEIHEEEGEFDWGIGLRYYAMDNLFLGGNLSTGTGEDPDMSLEAGVSLELAFDGRLWFEPMVRLTLPGEEYGVPNTFGLAWAFRYTF